MVKLGDFNGPRNNFTILRLIFALLVLFGHSFPISGNGGDPLSALIHPYPPVPKVRVVLAGWDVKGYDIPFPCEHFGLVEINQLPKLYGRCDAALVLSCSNLSLLPLELMASGVPVISNRAPYTQWLLNEENSMLAEPDIESLAHAVLQVISSPVLADRLRSAGLAFAAQTSWEQEAGVLADGLAQLTVGEPCKIT